MRHALPVLVEHGGGAIVNVASANARQPSPFNSEYSAAKAALTNLGTALSEEFAPQGVRVNTVSPGPVVTPWWTDAGGAAERFGAMVGADKDAVIATVAPEMMHLPRAGSRRRRRWRTRWPTWPPRVRRARPAPTSSSTAACSRPRDHAVHSGIPVIRATASANAAWFCRSERQGRRRRHADRHAG